VGHWRGRASTWRAILQAGKWYTYATLPSQL